jgi:hypothetical protein
MIRPQQWLGLGATLALAGLGCTGDISAPLGGWDGTGRRNPGETPGTGSGPGPATPANPAAGALDDTQTIPGPAPLRRLTLMEYQNTLRDLLGIEAAAVKTAGFASDQDSKLSGYVRGPALTTGTDARALMASADSLAQLALGKLSSLLPCSPVPSAGAEQDACAERFITQFGLRAFRRPLAGPEKDALLRLYQAQRGPELGASFEQAVANLVGAMLQTPYFLYHWELGPNKPVRDGALVRYNSYEMASRLSYLLWGTMPDARLFEAAAAGGLVSPEQIATESRRMLSDDKAKDAVRDFHMQWLEIGGLVDMPKDDTFTNYSPDVALAMAKETRAFVDSVFFGPRATGTIETLLTSNRSVIEPSLAKVYGVDAGNAGAKEVALDPAQRGGILTQGSFLAMKADASDSHPVRRADAVLHRVLCIELKVPDSIEVPPVADPNPMQTTRERFDVHGQSACARACHQLLDPVGFSFENYDAIGAYRTTENGKPVDASGSLTLPSGTIRFNNAIEMIKGLVKAPETADCMTRQWLRYALRRREVDSENASLSALRAGFESAGFDMRELMVALTRSRAFTHRVLSDGEVSR